MSGRKRTKPTDETKIALENAGIQLETFGIINSDKEFWLLNRWLAYWPYTGRYVGSGMRVAGTVKSDAVKKLLDVLEG